MAHAEHATYAVLLSLPVQEVKLGAPALARHTSTVHEGREYVYVLLADGQLYRYLYTRSQVGRALPQPSLAWP